MPEKFLKKVSLEHLEVLFFRFYNDYFRPVNMVTEVSFFLILNISIKIMNLQYHAYIFEITVLKFQLNGGYNGVNF